MELLLLAGRAFGRRPAMSLMSRPSRAVRGRRRFVADNGLGGVRTGRRARREWLG
jgi:hypothetical protein